MLYVRFLNSHPCAAPCLLQECSKGQNKRTLSCTSTVAVEGCSPAEAAPTGGTVPPPSGSFGPDSKSATSAPGAGTESDNATISHIRSQQQQAGVSTGLPPAPVAGTSGSTMQSGDMFAAARGPAGQSAPVAQPGEQPPSKRTDDIIPASEAADDEEECSDSMPQGCDGLHRPAPLVASAHQTPHLPPRKTKATEGRRSKHKRIKSRQALVAEVAAALAAASTPLGTVSQSQASDHTEPAQSQQVSNAKTYRSGPAVSKSSKKANPGAIADSSAAGPKSKSSHQVRAVKMVSPFSMPCLFESG